MDRAAVHGSEHSRQSGHSRQSVLAPLARQLAGVALRRTGLAAALWGEAGIGKTHACQEVLRGLICRSVSVHAASGFGALVLALPRPRTLSAWLEQSLGRLQSGQEAESADSLAVFSGLLAACAPVILQIEDLHEASGEQLAFWQGLATTVQRTRGVGLLAASRVQPPAPFAALRLPPLDRSGSDALLETEAGASLPSEALAWLFEHAAGNPLFTLEFFRLLARQGSLWNDGHLWRWRAPRRDALPITVEAVIERALLDVASMPVLEAARSARALLGADAPEQVWAEVAGLTPTDLTGAQAELERAGVLVQGEFIHPLYREVTLGHMPAARRQQLARRALAVYRGDPERAAAFVEQAGLAPTEASLLLEGAAQAASVAGRTASAARILARAADQAQGDARARLALQAARTLESVQPSEALRLARMAAEQRPDDPETALYLAGRLVQRERRLGDADEALRHLPAAVRTSAAWVAWQISFLMACGQFAEALDLWAARPDLHGQSGPATLYCVAGCLVHTGQPAQAAELARQGLAGGDPAGEGLTPTQRTQLLNVLSIACAITGNPEEAETHLVLALEVARAHGLTQLLGALLQNRAKNLDRTERYADALAAAQEAYLSYGEAGDGVRQANVGTMVAAFLTECGRYAEAETLLLDSVGLFERQEPSRFLALARLTLVYLYLDWQPPHGKVLALKLARAALEQAMLGQMPGITALAFAALARAEACSGNAQAALSHATEAVRRAGPVADESAFLSLAALATAHEAQGETGAAALAWQEAVEAATARGFTLDARRYALELARLTDAAEAARAHCDWFEAHGLLNGVNIARRYFPQVARLLPAPAPRARLDLLGTLRCTSGDAGDSSGDVNSSSGNTAASSGNTGSSVKNTDASRPVRGRRRQELLALLAEARLAGRAEVSRLDLLDALYPDTSEARANAALRDLVHQVRAEYGPGLVLTTAGGHALGEVVLDAEEFLADGDTRRWRGPYLAGLDLAGLEAGGAARDALYLALRARAEALLDSDPAEVARVGLLMLEADSYDLESLRLTLNALRVNRNHRSLGRVYAQARARLAEVGEALPERWTDFLALEIAQPIGATP